MKTLVARDALGSIVSTGGFSANETASNTAAELPRGEGE